MWLTSDGILFPYWNGRCSASNCTTASQNSAQADGVTDSGLGEVIK